MKNFAILLIGIIVVLLIVGKFLADINTACPFMTSQGRARYHVRKAIRYVEKGHEQQEQREKIDHIMELIENEI